MSCSAVNDPQRKKHWVTKNWNCGGSNSPEMCSASEVQIGIEKAPGCAWNGCVSCDDKTRYTCSPPYAIDTNTLWDCCSGSKSEYECDPSYCKNSNSCTKFLQQNCTGSILFSNDGSAKFNACNSWCSANPQACSATKIGYCTGNLSAPYCKAFAQEIANGGNSVFDAPVSTYCSSHPADPFCSCTLKPQAQYNGSDPNLLALLNAPQCYDASCISEGYENTKQVSFRKSGSCPTSICANTINVNDIKNSNISNIVAQCSSGSASTAGSGSVSTAGSGSVSTAGSGSVSTAKSGPTITSSSFLLFIFVIIYAVVFAMVYGVLTFSGSPGAPTIA